LRACAHRLLLGLPAQVSYEPALSDAQVQAINALLTQFKQMQKMMKQLSAGRMPRMFAGLVR